MRTTSRRCRETQIHNRGDVEHPLVGRPVRVGNAALSARARELRRLEWPGHESRQDTAVLGLEQR